MPGKNSPASILSILQRSIFIISLPFFLLSLILPVYGKEIGASVVEIGLFYSVFSFVTVILRPLVGLGLDRAGRRAFFLAGLGGYALTMLSFALISQVWGLVLARIIQGIASSLMWLSASAIISDVAGEDQRARSFGKITQSSSQGSILGTFLGFFLLGTASNLLPGHSTMSSWALLFLFFCLTSLPAFFLALRTLPETKPLHETQPEDTPIQWSRPWVLLLLVTFVTGMSVSMISPVLIIFLQERLGVGIGTLSWAFLPMGLVWAFLPAQFGKWADRIGRKPMMLAGLVAAALSSFIVPYLGSVIALSVIWAFQAMCYAAGDPAEQALVADLTGRQQRGRAYGFYLMCADLGATIGPLGGTWLYQTYGEAIPFYANGIILAVCALVLWAFLRVPSSPKSEQKMDQPVTV